MILKSLVGEQSVPILPYRLKVLAYSKSYWSRVDYYTDHAVAQQQGSYFGDIVMEAPREGVCVCVCSVHVCVYVCVCVCVRTRVCVVCICYMMFIWCIYCYHDNYGMCFTYVHSLNINVLVLHVQRSWCLVLCQKQQ